MLKQFVFSGFGGQGILTAGMLLANMASISGQNVTWIPSYGSEMRGGTANCSVKIDDHEQISSPFIKSIDYLIAMNKPSLDKFIPQMKQGGTIVIDSSIIKEAPEAKNITVVSVPAAEICSKLGNKKGLNICVIGALAAASDFFTEEQYEQGIKNYFKSKPEFHEANMAVFKAGYEHVKGCK